VSKLLPGLTLSNCIQTILDYSSANLPITSELSYIAENFHNLMPSEAASLGVDLVDSVLTNPHLRVDSEDDLFRFLFCIGEALPPGTDISPLIARIHAEFLTTETVSDLMAFVSQCEITADLWHALCHRLSRIDLTHTVYVGKGTPEGFFSVLRKRFGVSSAAESHSVTVMASSTFRGRPENLLSKNSTDYWSSNRDDTKPTITLGFPKGIFVLKGYWLKSHGHGRLYPIRWSVRGSNDGKSWAKIDYQDTNALNHDWAEAHFPVNGNYGGFQYIRFSLHEATGGAKVFRLSGIELFGNYIAAS
jgi:hypothetical protein